tara:strand:+ start:931 stop:1446 length:516 start_codon:yes stop_codon:yes gene_type:complete
MTKLPLAPYKTVCVSGGFDPVHIGHLRMLQEAATFGKVIAIVNSDDWLMRKKGYIFMPFEERCEILLGFIAVTETVAVNDADGTVCEALQRVKPTYFANGGDRKVDNTPEMKLCEELDIELLWNTGGGKIQSSSDLVNTSPMLDTTEDDSELYIKPSRVEIVTAYDLPKKS